LPDVRGSQASRSESPLTPKVGEAQSGASFLETLKGAIGHVNEMQVSADKLLRVPTTRQPQHVPFPRSVLAGARLGQRATPSSDGWFLAQWLFPLLLLPHHSLDLLHRALPLSSQAQPHPASSELADCPTAPEGLVLQADPVLRCLWHGVTPGSRCSCAPGRRHRTAA